MTEGPSEQKPATPGPVGQAGRATLMVMVFVLLSRILGVIRESVIGGYFGQMGEVDIYRAAFRIPDILQLLVAGGALATVFVPVFTEYWATNRQKDAWKVFSSVMTAVGIVAAVLVVVMELCAYPLARFMNPGLELPPGKAVPSAWSALLHPESCDAAQRAAWEKAAALSRILIPAQWFFFVGGLMTGTLNARKDFLIPSISPLVYNGGIILGAVLWHKTLGTAAMAVGAVLGAGIGTFLLPIFQLVRTGGRYRPALDTKHPGVRRVAKLLLPALLGLSLSLIGFWLVGSFTRTEGALAALSNAFMLTQAPIGIFAQASAVVLFPTLSSLAALKEWTSFRKEIHYGIRRILFLTVPASLLMAVLAEPIVTAVFLRGKFTAADVRAAAGALWCYSLGTFAWSAQAVLARGFYARQDSKTPVNITKFMVLALLGVYWLVARVLKLDYRALALALSGVGTVNMIVFLLVLQNRIGELGLRSLGRATAKITLAALASCAVAWGFLRLFWHGPAQAGVTGALIVTVLAGVAALAAYALACFLLRVPELHSVRAMLTRKKSHANPA